MAGPAMVLEFRILAMNLARFSRLRLGDVLTPLELLKKLTREFGGPEMWIKLDDCTDRSKFDERRPVSAIPVLNWI